MSGVDHRCLSQRAVCVRCLLVVQRTINIGPSVGSTAVSAGRCIWLTAEDQAGCLHVNYKHDRHLTPGRPKVQKQLHSLVSLNILRVSVAYALAAAPSTDGRACLPFCKKSYTWMTLPLCVLVSVSLTQSSTQACTRRWSGSSPAAARCSSLSLSHANTCVPLSPSPVIHTAFMSCLLHHLSHRYFSSHSPR